LSRHLLNRRSAGHPIRHACAQQRLTWERCMGGGGYYAHENYFDMTARDMKA
ncbi:MAG: hypothetical protein GY820_14480, partial [Gammaproteobacteria bacterium]|nr:hypothetical protein [Gammaproteobacteria bacterium]